MSNRVDLFKQMSDLTRPKCVECPNLLPHRCCDKMYCDLVTISAAEAGIKLPKTTGHPTLPYMGENGCVVPPHLRPACTLHVCSMNGMGLLYNKTGPGPFDREVDVEGTEKYFAIRDQIDQMYTLPQITQGEWEEYVAAQDQMCKIEAMTNEEAQAFVKEYAKYSTTVANYWARYGRDDLMQRYTESLTIADS